jgi:hypothetical protein
MEDQTAQINGIGTKIIVDTEDDLIGLTNPFISYLKPSGASGTWEAIDMGDGKIYYISVAGDLDEVGEWCLQANVKVTDWEGAGTKGTLTILANCV